MTDARKPPAPKTGAGSTTAERAARDESSNLNEQEKNAAGRVEHASDWAHDTYDRASAWAEDAYERGRDTMDRARSRSARMTRSVREYAGENPMVVGMVGLAAGFLIGALLPRTRREDQAFGEWSDDVREQGLHYAQEMTRRGRDYVDEALRADSESASESRPQHH